MGRDGEWVWFAGVRVVSAGVFSVACIVNGHKVPLPVAILHPDCTLEGVGDVGRLGVPRWWAQDRGLLADVGGSDTAVV